MRSAFGLILAASLALSSSQYPEGNPRYEQQQVQGEDLLAEQLESHPDLAVENQNHGTNAYRESVPAKEDYVIGLLVNPCGANGTHGGIGGNALGYDCCVDRFGQGEYGFLVSDEAIGSDGKSTLQGLRVAASRVLAGPDEILHNIVLVDEDGSHIPNEYSRRADDESFIDESCKGLRDPRPSCLSNRLRAEKSKLMPPCTDNNQTVDASLDCYSPDGKRSQHCMQIAYSQTSFIHVCGGEFANDDHCGTFVEIHRQNGSPYDHENVPLAATKITKRVTNGMSTTAIPLTYKDDPSRIMCAYQETKIRVGSMVRITKDSPTCCCPPVYSARTEQIGSFFCPRTPRTRDGPFAATAKSLKELVEVERHESKYPLCHLMSDDEDALMCSTQANEHDFSEYNYPSKDERNPKVSGRFFSYPCDAVTKGADDKYGSKELNGRYDETCPLDGQAFSGCALATLANRDSNGCSGDDSSFTFKGEAGKVVKLPSRSRDAYGVSFNDGRTVYFFAKHELELLVFDNTYELWFVQRNRFETIVQTKKSFRVFWPRCSFDAVNDQYFPFAQLDDRGEPMSVFSEFDGDVTED